MSKRTGWFACLVLLATCAAPAQIPRSNAGKPSDDLPRPYRTIRDWAELPDGKSHVSVWPASVTAVEAARDGTSFVAYRCFENSYAPEAAGKRRQVREKHVRL